MLFADKLTLDAPRRTADGFLIVRAKSARSGVYKYDGAEVDPQNEHGLRDAGLVNVLREPAAVFDKRAVHSFIGKPITIDHPSEPVTADNWKDHAGGTIMGAMRDGEHLSFDLLFTDKAAISAVDGGKRELSAGYAADLEFGDFKAEDGTACPVRQSAIRGNHVALVDRGRAGSECSITDAARCSSLPADVLWLLTDERTYSGENGGGNNEPARRETSNSGGSQVATKTITFDGLPLEVTDAAEAAITKLQGQITALTADKATAATDLATANTTLAARDAEIVTLKQAVEDAKVSPAQLRDQAKAYALVCDKAKALGVKFADDADATDIMKAVVEAKMGDTAKSYDGKQIAAAFDVLTKDAKVETRDTVREVISSQPVNVADARAEYEKARDKARGDISNGWRRPDPANANAA
jgi:uncharacterized protein